MVACPYGNMSIIIDSAINVKALPTLCLTPLFHYALLVLLYFKVRFYKFRGISKNFHVNVKTSIQISVHVHVVQLRWRVRSLMHKIGAPATLTL